MKRLTTTKLKAIAVDYLVKELGWSDAVAYQVSKGVATVTVYLVGVLDKTAQQLKLVMDHELGDVLDEVEMTRKISQCKDYWVACQGLKSRDWFVGRIDLLSIRDTHGFTKKTASGKAEKVPVKIGDIEVPQPSITCPGKYRKPMTCVGRRIEGSTTWTISNL